MKLNGGCVKILKKQSSKRQIVCMTQRYGGQREEKGPRTIDTLIGMIVVAAKEYKNRVDNAENVY